MPLLVSLRRKRVALELDRNSTEKHLESSYTDLREREFSGENQEVAIKHESQLSFRIQLCSQFSSDFPRLS
jgi:hypothetical protein